MRLGNIRLYWNHVVPWTDPVRQTQAYFGIEFVCFFIGVVLTR
jgi:hypothetical protein